MRQSAGRTPSYRASGQRTNPYRTVRRDRTFRALDAVATNRQARLYSDVRGINDRTGVTRAAQRDIANYLDNARETRRNELRSAFGVKG